MPSAKLPDSSEIGYAFDIGKVTHPGLFMSLFGYLKACFAEAAKEHQTRIATIQRIEDARNAGRVLAEDAQELLGRFYKAKSSEEKSLALNAAKWLLDPQRTGLTPRETKRVRDGLPRLPTPWEKLSQ